MAKFSKIIGTFLDNFDVHHQNDTVPLPRLSSRYVPGKVIAFNYPGGDQRLALVVSNKRGAGIFFSGQKSKTGWKLLVSCFKLDDVSFEIANIILNKLYNNEKRASYSKILKGLKTTLGTDRYRTYHLSKMSLVEDISFDDLGIFEEEEEFEEI